jgi:hypothetical protein
MESVSSPGSCEQVRLRACGTTKAACCTFGRTSTVSDHDKFGYIGMYVDYASFYEGHSMDKVTFATRVCKLLGVETMIGKSRGIDHDRT